MFSVSDNIFKCSPENGIDIAICSKRAIENDHFKNKTSDISDGAFQRAIEKKGIEVLVRFLFGKQEKVVYRQNGAPFIKNSNKHISISHSKQLIAVALNTNPIGIDIEVISSRPKKIAQRFLHEQEHGLFTTEVELTSAWTIKEALYKLGCPPGISFKTGIRILKILEKEDMVYLCEIRANETPEKIFCRSVVFDNHVLTFTSNFEYHIS